MDTKGKITAVNGNLIAVEFDGAVAQNEVGYARLGELRLMCEIVRIRGTIADMQVFEDTIGLAVGDDVEFTGDLLSVELGPGLLRQIYDGLQNPLPRLAEQCGFFLERGTYLRALDEEQKWAFTPKAEVGATVTAGETLGSVPEGIFEHRIMVPFARRGEYTVKSVSEAGEYTIDDTIAVLTDDRGNDIDINMVQRWPVKLPITCFEERLRPTEPKGRGKTPLRTCASRRGR